MGHQANGSNNDEYVRLLGAWPSPFVLRTRIALNLKHVPYEYLEEEDSLNSESVINYNPVHKQIPILIHGNKPIRESLNIVMYVDETWLSGPPILPSDPFDRAVARFWDVYIDEHCFTSINGVAVAKTEEERKEAIAKLEQCMGLLEETFQECSKGRGFFGGDNIGFIDIGFGSMLGPIKVLEKFTGVKFIHPENTPGLFHWVDRFYAHEAVKPVMPDIGKLVQFARLKFNSSIFK
ncbi:unnamed protein product [Microthlaspi erraticum]|uniref:Glutathione S-transferase n=1 Tax=Microthlaspi erraticum TaxID=1685480 RepID=A0A6D2INA0_9BRAS|nr:unnamed protein product [Microthlaspi erraticum]